MLISGACNIQHYKDTGVSLLKMWNIKISHGSSISIVPDYEAEDFSSRLCIQLPIQWVLGVLHLRVKHSWDVTLTIQPI
jgi:hypothetical protein